MPTLTRSLIHAAALLGVVAGAAHGQQAPFRLSGTVSGPTTVVLSWTAPPSAVRYYVQRAPDGGSFANLGTPKITGTTYTDVAAPGGAAVRYRVIAKFSGAPDKYSNAISVTTGAPASTASSAPPATPPATAPNPSTPAAEDPGTAIAIEPGPPTVMRQPQQPLRSNPVTASPQPVLRQSPAPTPMTVAPSTAAVTPVNPSEFKAKQTGDGQVQLSWQPVEGASYYLLLGPGLPEGAAKVSGAATFTATGVPPGFQEWAVASYYDPGPVSTPAAEFPRASLTVSELVLSGWADLHTHPMVHLGFGGKLVHGGVDEGSLLPQDLTCKGRTRATSIAHALSDDRPSHGGWNAFSFTCGDNLRSGIIIPGFQRGNHALVTSEITNGPAVGYPEFRHWPRWDDITHQKMWYEWIRRARDGGLRVMVALATNNKTLGDAVSGPGDGPTDDKTAGDLQLTEMKAFVGRHPDFMEVALDAADVRRIVQANKIAVVLGVELDNIGNFNLPELRPLLSGPAANGIISGEIQRLYNAGVRYVIPIHVIDNVFGGTAIYESGFNTSNFREAGHFWEIECANDKDGITYTYDENYDLVKAMAAFMKIGLDPLRRSGPGPVCPRPGGGGHRNARGLTLHGMFAIKEMMKRGMIVDIDHMSQQAADATLNIAEQFGYPIVSGHNGIRGYGGGGSENSRTRDQLARISRLHGMFGLGTAGVHQSSWANQYESAVSYMGYQHADTSRAIYRSGAVAFGTDLNGFVKGPKAAGTRAMYAGWLPPSTTGTKTWYYDTDGVAHYGMLADFVRGVSLAPANTYGGRSPGMTGSELVDHHLNRSANYFWQMWRRIEARKGSVQ